ncbi:MAG: AI-2E family transporter [Pseudomonadota bacterium]
MNECREKAPIPEVASSFALGFIVICLVIYILNVARAIVIPFVIAVFVWYLINAMARGFGRGSLGGRSIPRLACFTLAILALAFGVWEIFELISQNIALVAKAAPLYQKNLEELVPKIVLLLHIEHQPTVQELFTYLDLGSIMTTMVKMLSGIAGKTLVVMFYTGFLLYEQRFFDKKISGMIGAPETERHVRHILRNIDIKVQRYIWVKTLVSALAGILTFVVLRSWQVDFAAFWGLMAFFLNFIPYIGALTAIVLPAMIALVQFSDMTTFLIVLAGLSAVHGGIGHALDPFLMGKSLNLSPIFIISSLAMWGMIWGIPGMFLSIPILAVVMITLSQFPATRPIAVLLSKTGVIDPDGTEQDGGKT